MKHNKKSNNLKEKISVFSKKASLGPTKKLSVKMKICVIFLLFSAVVFVLMWMLEVVFLQTFYPFYKKGQAVKATNEIESLYSEDDEDDIDSVAFDNNLCVEIIGNDGFEKERVDVLNGHCMLHNNNVDMYILLDKLNESKNGSYTVIVNNKELQSNIIVIGRKIKDSDGNEAFLFTCCALAPVDSFINIIKTQTLYILCILLVLSIIFTIYISNYIAKPINKLTKSAQQMAEGNLDTKFEGDGYAEVEQLAMTLEYAESEIKKVEVMQKDLIANTSHDLRTPLTMMKAYAEMIRDLSGNNPEKRNQHLQIIIDETDRLTAIVNDILDLSKLESGSITLEKSNFDITEKISAIYKRYVEFSCKKEFHIFFEAPGSIMVNCDENKIERVICNLINNAINYTAGEKNVYLREIIEKGSVLIEVEDTGDGIEEDKINLIFDKYYRSENHKRETIGTGLGLTIVKTILQMHNYEFGVRSVVGKGSTFWFRIRLDK